MSILWNIEEHVVEPGIEMESLSFMKLETISGELGLFFGIKLEIVLIIRARIGPVKRVESTK